MSLAATIAARLASARPVRRTLPGGGRLHVDRPLPFLCVHRVPADRADPGTAHLVRTQASYLVASGDPANHEGVSAIVDGVVGALVDSCGACMLLEIWTAGDGATRAMRIAAPGRDEPASTIGALATALRDLTIPYGAPTVSVDEGAAATPPGMVPLVSPALAARRGVLVAGLEVTPFFRAGGAVFPQVLRPFSHQLAIALQRAFFEFIRVQTGKAPDHHLMLGRRRMVKAVRFADAALGDIERSFDLLLAVSPVNTEDAWREFGEGGRRHAPALRYRMLTVDPEVAKRRLYDLPLERLEDPVLALLLRDKRRELDAQLDLLEDRGTPRFLAGSQRLYGGVDDALLAEARTILASHPPGGQPATERCDGEAIAVQARAELAHYRATDPTLASEVQLRDDIASLMVSHGNVLIPRQASVATDRVAALLHHEVGTHVVTFANGRAQPLQLFASGLAGYEALQEGLALFAEYLAGGLDASRLRLIAARAIAVRRLVEGADFPTIVEELVGHGLGARTAFRVAVRVFRGGGLTKDAIYLRGLVALLDHLAAGRSLEPLLVGKIALDHVPLVEELLWRQVLVPPRLRPRWLDAPGAEERLQRARSGLRPSQLLSLH